MPPVRNPVRSETDAFRLTVVGVAVAVVSVLVGWLATPLAGAIVFVVLGLAVLAVVLVLPDRGRRLPLREAAREGRPRRKRAGTRHVLVVANEPLGGEELRRRIGGAESARVEVDVLAPVLSSRAHLAVTDIDQEMEQARRRLERSLAWARAQGFIAHGEVGDPSPTTAIEDHLRRFGADEVIVVTASADTGDRQEQEQLQRLRGELDVPVVHVAAGLS